MNTNEQDDDFRIKFSDKFFEIARMADKSDDEGYGKGLVKLLLDIDGFIRETREQAKKEERERIKKLIKEKGLHLGYKNNILDII